MKLTRLLVPFSIILTLAGAPIRAADAPATAAGYWEGAIVLPNRELGIRVEITRGAGASWQGTIDIPLQGLRGYKLDPLAVDGSAVTFGLPGLPGEPRFAGKLSTNANTIAGDFSQGPGKFPFKLERKEKPAKETIDETPASGVPGKGLAGNWRGSLKPMPNIELRLSLELTQTAAGKPEGVLVSLDQDNARIPVSGLTEADGVVHFETESVGGVFDGKVNADGSEIVGGWKQGGGTLPLVFKRMPKATGPSGSAERR